MKKLLFALLLFIVVTGSIYAQSSINPDISLIGTFNTFTNFIKGTPGYGKLNFNDPEMELFVEGYLNPYSRAAANISYEQNTFSVEELYGNILRGLPFDMQIKAGKFLVGFGKLNTVHPHAWPFLERPLYHQVFFGDGGLNDVGISFNFLLPTGDVFTNLDLGIFKGRSMISQKDSNAVDRGINPIFVGRLSTFWSLDDYTNLEVGLSGSYGVYSKGNLILFSIPRNLTNIETFNYLYGGLDFKFKYSPDAYTVLTLQGEGILNHRSVPRIDNIGIDFTKASTQTITNSGFFIYADYKFQKQFSFGVKYDYTAGILGDLPTFYSLSNDDKNSTQGIETWFAYYPVEETSVVRLGLQNLFYNYGNGTNRPSETTIKLQFLFSLGPHKAHPF